MGLRHQPKCPGSSVKINPRLNCSGRSSTTRPQGPGTYVQHVRTVVRLVQKATLHDEAQDLLVGQALVRLLGQRGNLPEDNPKGPARREET